MSAHTDQAHRKGDSFEYRALVVVSYPIFFVGAVLGRMMPAGEHATAGPVMGSRPSVFSEARAATETYVPFAFMG